MSTTANALRRTQRRGRRLRHRPRCIWHTALGIWYTTAQVAWQRSIEAHRGKAQASGEGRAPCAHRDSTRSRRIERAVPGRGARRRSVLAAAARSAGGPRLRKPADAPGRRGVRLIGCRAARLGRQRGDADDVELAASERRHHNRCVCPRSEDQPLTTREAAPSVRRDQRCAGMATRRWEEGSCLAGSASSRPSRRRRRDPRASCVAACGCEPPRAGGKGHEGPGGRPGRGKGARRGGRAPESKSPARGGAPEASRIAD